MYRVTVTKTEASDVPIEMYKAVDFGIGKDRTAFRIERVESKEPYPFGTQEEWNTMIKKALVKNKPMKKYIWAKEGPFHKKGDEIEGGPILNEKERLLAEGWIEEAGRFKPECKEFYWCVNSRGISRTAWFGDAFDRECYERGNVFKTEEDALAAAEKVKALLLSLHE